MSGIGLTRHDLDRGGAGGRPDHRARVRLAAVLRPVGVVDTVVDRAVGRLEDDSRAAFPAALATGHLLQVLGVPGPLHRDLRGRGLDLAEVVGRQLDGRRPEVLLQAMQLRGARDGDDPGLLGEQPGERDLGRRRLLPLGDLAEQVDQGLVRLPGLRREAGDGAAEVGAVELGVLVDLPREEALAQRAEGDEADAQLLAASAAPPPRASATTASTRSGRRRPAGPRGPGGWSARPPRRGRSA